LQVRAVCHTECLGRDRQASRVDPEVRAKTLDPRAVGRDSRFVHRAHELDELVGELPYRREILCHAQQPSTDTFGRVTVTATSGTTKARTQITEVGAPK